MQARIITPHPNIIDFKRIYFGYDYNLAKLVFHCVFCMELCEDSLENFAIKRGKDGQGFTTTEIKFIIGQIANALAFLKNVLNINHRDIKPSNILVSKVENG